ncbi:MAG: hypothetical protein NUV72_08625 [Bauldia sp.]|nr:hypothetical protein [Bauldia sp.]
MKDRDSQSHDRAGDKAMMRRVADSSILAVVGRVSATVLVAVSLFIGGRLLTQLEANTGAIEIVTRQQAVTSAILDGIVKRVEGLEDRERMR